MVFTQRISEEKIAVAELEKNGLCFFFFLIGVFGRFLTNAKKALHVAKSELCAFTVELHPLTATALSKQCDGADYARSDVHITCMDFAGELGGAIAFSADPLLANGIWLRLEEHSLPVVRKKLVILLRHTLHVLLSDRVSFHLLLRAVQLWSYLAGSERLKWHCADTIKHADKIFKFLMAFKVENVRGESQGEKKATVQGKINKNDNCKVCGSKTVISGATFGLKSFLRPYCGALVWMINATKAMQDRAEDDCISFWEFLSNLASDVEVVVAGEPTTPQCCVASHCDTLLLRVHSPNAAANILRAAGFDAAPAITRVWNSGSSKENNDRTKPELLSSTLREVVILPDCPKCATLAKNALFFPFYREIKFKSRQKLCNDLLRTFSLSCFSSPSEEFRRHVSRTPFRHAYRSKEVADLIALWRRRCTNVKAFFAEPQSVFLWMLLGPLPGYLCLKL